MGDIITNSGLFSKEAIVGQVSTTWILMAVLVILSICATSKLKTVPGKLQNAAEMSVSSLDGFFEGILGEHRARNYFPLFGTMFIFILVSNYSDLLPFAGHISWLQAPTSTLSVTAGLAIIIFLATHFLGFKAHGFSYLKHFISPLAFMLPLNIIEEVVRPFSLALRLYGNIFGEETVTHQLFQMCPIIVPLVMNVLSILFCLIQAVVFTMLSAVYIEGATGAGH